MDGACPDPFQGGIVSSELTSIPPIIIGIPSTRPIFPGPSGPIVTAHTVVGSLHTSGGFIPAIVFTTIPPFIPGGSGPSTSVWNIPAIPVNFPAIRSQPHPPTVMHGNKIPTATSTIIGPARATLGSILPFMASLNLPDLAWLTNDPICHHPQWPPIPTKLPSDISKFEGKVGEDPQNHIMSFHLWCSSNSIVDNSVQLSLF